jgi:hypothetical protein
VSSPALLPRITFTLLRVPLHWFGIPFTVTLTVTITDRSR